MDTASFLLKSKSETSSGWSDSEAVPDDAQQTLKTHKMIKLAISYILSVWNYFYAIKTEYALTRCILWEEIGLAIWGDEFETRGSAICKIIWE